MRRVSRFAVAGLLGAAAMAAAVAGPANAAPAPEVLPAATSGDVQPAGTGFVNCGYAYNWCMSLRRAMLKDGYQLGPMWYDPPDCTAPGGCTGGYKFYYYW